MWAGQYPGIRCLAQFFPAHRTKDASKSAANEARCRGSGQMCGRAEVSSHRGHWGEGRHSSGCARGGRQCRSTCWQAGVLSRHLLELSQSRHSCPIAQMIVRRSRSLPAVFSHKSVTTCVRVFSYWTSLASIIALCGGVCACGEGGAERESFCRPDVSCACARWCRCTS